MRRLIVISHIFFSGSQTHAQRLSETIALDEPSYGGGSYPEAIATTIGVFALTYVLMKTVFSKIPPSLSWVPALVVSNIIFFLFILPILF